MSQQPSSKLHLPWLSMDIPTESPVDNCEWKPKIGMEFECEEAAYYFYSEYGRRCGFSVRKDTFAKNKQTGEITSRIYVCSKEGLTTRKDQSVKNGRMEARCGCMANMGIKLKRSNGKYEVNMFKEEHNHPLVPAAWSHMLTSQQRLSMDITTESPVDNCEWKPKIGMEFECQEAAYNFYNEYGRQCGFSIRKDSFGRNKQTGEITSRVYVCSKEGVKKGRDRSPKNARAETRCGCEANMGIKLKRVNGKYEVNIFKEEHNHPLVPAASSHVLTSQQRTSDTQATNIDLAEQSITPLTSTCELFGRQAEGRECLDLTKADQKNYLSGKRQKNMVHRKAGSSYTPSPMTDILPGGPITRLTGVLPVPSEEVENFMGPIDKITVAKSDSHSKKKMQTIPSAPSTETAPTSAITARDVCASSSAVPPSAIWDVVLEEIQGLGSKISNLDKEIQGLGSKISNLDSFVRHEFDVMDTRLTTIEEHLRIES